MLKVASDPGQEAPNHNLMTRREGIMMKPRCFAVVVTLVSGILLAWLPQVFVLLLSGGFATLPLEYLVCISFPLVMTGAFWAGRQRLMRRHPFQALGIVLLVPAAEIGLLYFMGLNFDWVFKNLAWYALLFDFLR